MADSLNVPEVRPIEIGCFELTATGLMVKGRPSFEEYQGAGDFIRRAHQAAGWWLVEWIAYGESREDWRDRLDQAIDAGVVNENTVRQYRYVGRNVPVSNRIDGLPFALHVEVASLPKEEQRGWLEKAKEENWSTRELRTEIRTSKRAKVVEGQARLQGMYRVIYADPPWAYRDSGATADGSLGKAERHYRGMSIEDLCKLPVAAHARPDSILFLWVTAAMLLENPGPREVIDAWGFKAKTGRVWNKVLGLPGHYGMQVVHEHLIIATRGVCLPDVPLPHDASVLTVRRSDEHSSKPEEMRAFIEKHWAGPYIELFGRRKREGWSVFGNDARLWANDAKTQKTEG